VKSLVSVSLRSALLALVVAGCEAHRLTVMRSDDGREVLSSERTRQPLFAPALPTREVVQWQVIPQLQRPAVSSSAFLVTPAESPTIRLLAPLPERSGAPTVTEQRCAP
jgi:hypothetical protein